MFVFVVPAVLAGLLGVLAHQAESPAAYLPRLRLLFLGSVALGYLGPAAFIWRKAQGWRRWGSLLLALATLRAAYLPVLGAAFLTAAWCDRLGRALGAESLGGLIHYALACFIATLASRVALLSVAAATRIKKPGWVAWLVCVAGMGVIAFWNPKDRAVLPHPIVTEAPPPASNAPGYFDVVKDGGRPPVTRILAAGGAVLHTLAPRTGWGGSVRVEMQARFRGNPDLSLGERVTALEASLLSAREEFRTSPRTPPP